MLCVLDDQYHTNTAKNVGEMWTATLQKQNGNFLR